MTLARVNDPSPQVAIQLPDDEKPPAYGEALRRTTRSVASGFSERAQVDQSRRLPFSIAVDLSVEKGDRLTERHEGMSLRSSSGARLEY